MVEVRSLEVQNVGVLVGVISNSRVVGGDQEVFIRNVMAIVVNLLKHSLNVPQNTMHWQRQVLHQQHHGGRIGTTHHLQVMHHITLAKLVPFQL